MKATESSQRKPMTLTLASLTEWLVTHGWPKIDADDRWIPEEGEIIFTPSREQYWIHCIHESGQFVSVTPAYELLDEFQDCSYNDACITFRFDHAGVLEDIAYIESHSNNAFAITDAVNGFSSSDLPNLIKGLKTAYTAAIRCLDVGQEFTQERLEESLQFDLKLFALFDVPERQEAS